MVSEIYNLDPATGTSIIKVAEMAPTNDVKGLVTYSWREWCITNNQQVRILRICKEPFEPFQGRRIKLR
jgi:hypothetical protein